MCIPGSEQFLLALLVLMGSVEANLMQSKCLLHKHELWSPWAVLMWGLLAVKEKKTFFSSLQAISYTFIGFS